jgi:regulator of RNase E activity RraA
MLSDHQLAELARWNTPTVYNAWEALTSTERTEGRFNRDAITDYTPARLAMVGFAVTVEFEPSNARWPRENPKAWNEYREYVASVPGQKIVVAKDLDGAATVGAFFGEVNTTVHRALGCVGAITDGALRDLDEVRILGFRHLARRLCIGHAYSCPVRWNVPVEVFGCEVRPGDLIHADTHGFLVIPEPDQVGLLDAVAFLDDAERTTLIAAANAYEGPIDELPGAMAAAKSRFDALVRERFRSGETA